VNRNHGQFQTISDWRVVYLIQGSLLGERGRPRSGVRKD